MSSQKMVCHCSTAGEHDPKNLINMSTEPGTTPDNTKECGNSDCKVTKKDIHAMFPGLQARPRPEPNLSVKDNHDAWLQEYHHWGALKCPCGRGYFCRAHGSWISGEEVGSGAAVASDEQQQGSCPAYHYGDYSGVTSYIGERDAFVASPDSA